MLDRKSSLSVDSLRMLLDRNLSTLTPKKLRSIVEDTLQALDDIERAAAVPVVLSAAQAADQRTAILTRAHDRVLRNHTFFLVLLGRVPSDYSIHEATPRELQALEEEEDDDEEEDEDDDDEEEGDDEVNDKVCNDTDDDREASDDNGEASDDNDDDEDPILSAASAHDRPWWTGYLDATVRYEAFGRRYGQQSGLRRLLRCLVFWDEAHPFPDALVRRFMPNRGVAAVDPASGETIGPEPSVADFLQPLVDENIVQTHPDGHLCVSLWSRYISQRHMRLTFQLRSFFASTLRILAELRLQPLESQAETWDGYVAPSANVETFLTPLPYMKLLVPYGMKEDGSAEWEQVGRRYQESREQGVPMALQECPLESLRAEGAETRE